MEQESFDQITRALAADRSRRGVVRGLAGAAMGGVLVAAGGRAADAKPRKKKRCKSPKSKCRTGKKTVCVDLQTDASNCGACGTICPGDQGCCNSACVSTSGTVALIWKPWVNPTAPGDHGYCYPTIDVTDFAPGTYQGYAGNIEVTVVVGEDGTGSGSNPGTITANDGSSYVATVNCIASAPAITDCWA